MRVAVLGAGAIGCFLAARLADSGHEVLLIGRQAQVAAIRERGLTLTLPDGSERTYRLRAETVLLERPDVILLTVKSQDVAQACIGILPVARDVPVVALQNGVQAEDLAASVLGREPVLGGVVMIAASYLEPGRVQVQFAGWVLIGEPFGPVSERTERIAELLRAAVPTYVTMRLREARWSKLVSNLNNGICAATGLALPEVVREETGRLLSLKVMKEGVAVARALGIAPDHTLYGWRRSSTTRRNGTTALVSLLQSSMSGVLARMPEALALSVLGAAGRSRLSALPIRGSTWQSIARGSPSEIAYLNGEVVRRGREVGVATPFNDRLVECVRDVERTGRCVPLQDLLPEYLRAVTISEAGRSVR